jgi:hypothetical protein
VRVHVANSAVLAIVLAAACNTEPTSADRFDIWRANGPSRYTWTIEWSEPVFGPHRVTATVVDGRPVTIVPDADNRSAGPDAEKGPLTVERLFRVLLHAESRARLVHVDWNARFGYPARIEIDYSDAVDDEVAYRVIRFEPAS